ncbi:PilZ domain-containing protein [Marinibactrum halimedae]|uniref:PilZ domain-containing protein n=1 Tax=Marinibactrum halimedae TaxID=1444977 RepID=A0AA37WNY3_9GAMM|nr:PilZ domain-containing protein [Marinibactrum halimedae]MCD9460510.1 PilZ domain-containing protein [Marinibactrum halimedae]GLS27873.1 hypothetical protein GCM10007877_35920 [Marinibactrum halimedae]
MHLDEPDGKMHGNHLRHFRRHDLKHTVHVIDAVTSQPMGRIANISLEGLMLIGQLDAKPDHLYQLTVILPAVIAGEREINIGADCLWVKHLTPEDQSMVWAGFQIIDFDPKAKIVIEALMTCYEQESIG